MEELHRLETRAVELGLKPQLHELELREAAGRADREIERLQRDRGRVGI